MGGDFFRLRALLRVAPGPQGHARPHLPARLSHLNYAPKSPCEFSGLVLA